MKNGFLLGMGGLVALACLALLPALEGPWIFDDVPLIGSNVRVHTLSLDNVRFFFTHDLWDVGLGASQAKLLSYYRPLVTLSYAVDWWLGGGGSVMFHVTNVLLHAATILLAGRAVRRWSGSRAGALLAAGYFGLHPARAESAAWISGRPDLLATLGTLLCLEGVSALCDSKRASGTLLFTLGLLVAFASKETALLLPMLVLIELRTAPSGGAFPDFRKAWPLLASVAAAGSYSVARQLWLPMRPFAVTGLAGATHLGFVFETLGRAAAYLAAPFDLSLSGAALTERGGKVAPDLRYLALGVVAALLLGGGLRWTRRHRRRAFWALVAFLVSLVPTLNIVWIGGATLTSPRFFYLPSLLLAWFAVELGRDSFQAVSPRVRLLAGTGSAAVLTLLLALQSTNYASLEQFWASELRSRPDVPNNIAAFIKRDWARAEPERALARSLCQYQISLERFRFLREGGRIILKTLEPWAGSLPDAEQSELGAIADFLAAAREPTGPAVLGAALRLEVPPGSKVRTDLVGQAPALQTQEAAIRVRLGEGKRALQLVRAARAGCPRCTDLLERQAFIAYRAFDADYAEQLAQGSLDGHWGELTKREALQRLRALNRGVAAASGLPRLQLQVRRLREVGLYGEALRLLQQAQREEPAAAPDHSLLELLLSVAAAAGDQPLSEQLARQLGVPQPPVAPRLSIEQTKRYITQLHDGCAYPEELL